MAEDSEYLRRDLLATIAARRAAVQAFLHENRPKFRRRANLTVVLSSVAAILTAGPALGGEQFSTSVQKSLGLSTDSLVWRFLCLGALVVSVSAAILTNLAKSQDVATRLSAAEAAAAEMEGLTTLLEFGHLPLDEAVKLYQQYAVKISFVDELPEAAARPA
jgi:hypothetical protein